MSNYASVKGPKQGQLKPGSTKTNLSSKNLQNLQMMQGAGAGKPRLKGFKPPANDGRVSGKTVAGFNRTIGQPSP
jgi:hypothetical protein